MGAQVPGVSLELCGGTHVERTGQLYPFRIVSESAVAAGVRRIEGVAGKAAVALLLEREARLREVASALKVRGRRGRAGVGRVGGRLAPRLTAVPQGGGCRTGGACPGGQGR